MKCILLFIAIFLTLPVCAQQEIPNNGFENWTNVLLWDNPVPFTTSNAAAFFNYDAYNVFKSENAHGGDYAVLMQAGNLELELSSHFGLGYQTNDGFLNPW